MQKQKALYSMEGDRGQEKPDNGGQQTLRKGWTLVINERR